MLPALALLGLPQTILGGIQAYQAFRGLKALQNQPEPNYTVSPELKGAYDRAQSMATRGFTAGEEAAFKSNLASSNNAAQYNLRQQVGGNLAGSLFAGIQGRNIGALNKFAADDAALNRQNIRYADSIGQAIQQQQNMATNTDIQRRNQKEQAYGNAFKTGTENIVGGINYGASLAAPALKGFGGVSGMAQSAGGFDPRPMAEVSGAPVSTNPYSGLQGLQLGSDQEEQQNMLYKY